MLTKLGHLCTRRKWDHSSAGKMRPSWQFFPNKEGKSALYSADETLNICVGLRTSMWDPRYSIDEIGPPLHEAEMGPFLSWKNAPISLCRTAQAKNAKSGLREILPWKPFRTLFLPLFVARSSAARCGKPCPLLDLRPCCMSPERPF